MFLLQKATQVTHHDDSGDDLAAWLRHQYAYPAARTDGTPRVRTNFVASIDGAATADGRSGALGSDGDRLLFGILRELADAILVGAATALAENYRVPQPRPDGTRPALVLASRSLDIPKTYDVIADPDTLIATCAAAPAERRHHLESAGATLIDCGDDTVEPSLLIAALAARGHGTVLCEGGPRLHADLLAAGVVDQLAVTLSPNLACGEGPRIAHGPTPPGGLVPARLHHLIGDDDGFLYFLWDAAPPGATVTG